MTENREQTERRMDQKTSLSARIQDEELEPRECGVEDIDRKELRHLVNRIRFIVNSHLSARVSSIYVVGSFARGEAREVASDLDLRIVIQTWKRDDEMRACEHLLKNEYSAEVCPTVCGYLDPHITLLEPGRETPHVEVFGL